MQAFASLGWVDLFAGEQTGTDENGNKKCAAPLSPNPNPNPMKPPPPPPPPRRYIFSFRKYEENAEGGGARGGKPSMFDKAIEKEAELDELDDDGGPLPADGEGGSEAVSARLSIGEIAGLHAKAVEPDIPIREAVARSAKAAAAKWVADGSKTVRGGGKYGRSSTEASEGGLLR